MIVIIGVSLKVIMVLIMIAIDMDAPLIVPLMMIIISSSTLRQVPA